MKEIQMKGTRIKSVPMESVRKRFFSIGMIILLCLLSCACGATETVPSNSFVTEYNEMGSDGHYLYNVSDESMSYYDLTEQQVNIKSSWENTKFTSVETYASQFVNSSYFSVSDSYVGNGCIFKNCDNRLEVIYNCPEGYIFAIPFAYDFSNDITYFAIEKYADDNEKALSYFIVTVSETGVSEIGAFDLAAPPYSGIVVDGVMHFTSYNYETEKFDLYAWNIADELKDIKIEEHDLQNGNVFYDGTGIITSQEGVYQFGNTKIDETTKLFQWNTDIVAFSSLNDDHTVQIIDARTGTVKKEYSDIAGYNYNNGSLYLYAYSASVYEVKA